jgi:hypothetical protein
MLNNMKKQIIIIAFLLFSISLTAQKISDLPPATHLDSNNLFPVVQTGVTKKLKASEILNYIVSQYPLDSLAGLPLTVTTTDYVSSSGSEAIAFTNLQVWNDTLDLGSATTRENNRIYVLRTDYFGNAVVINATPSMEYKSRSAQEFRLDKNMTGCILQSNGVKWYILGVFYDPYYRPTLAAFADSASVGGYTAHEILTVSGGVNIGASGGTHEGTMQYNGTNFEGYDGSAWIPFDNWKRDAVNGEIYPNNTNDQLGLGTTDPAEQLDITKNFRLVNTTASTGIIYKGTSPWLHDFNRTGTTGANIFLGGAGNLTLTGSSAGDQGSLNIGIGRQVMPSLTIGRGNTIMGDYAGYSLTEGIYNTAIGQASLQFATTSSQNTAVGWYALRLNTAGNNTAVTL